MGECLFVILQLHNRPEFRYLLEVSHVSSHSTNVLSPRFQGVLEWGFQNK